MRDFLSWSCGPLEKGYVQHCIIFVGVTHLFDLKIVTGSVIENV